VPLLAYLWNGNPTLAEAILYEAGGILATFLTGFLSYHLYERHFLALKTRLAPVGAT
jgi:uncharacterized membrane protein YfcA